MNFSFEVTAATPPPDLPPATAGAETADLLRQLLEVQREQLALQRAASSAHDAGARWRAFLARWQTDFPELPGACKHVLPQLERAYITLIADLTEYLRREEGESLDNEFALGDFLDRYGMRLGQLGTVLSLVSPLAEAAPPTNESP